MERSCISKAQDEEAGGAGVQPEWSGMSFEGERRKRSFAGRTAVCSMNERMVCGVGQL